MNLAIDFGRYGSRSAELNMGMSSAAPGKTFDTTDITSMGMTREARVSLMTSLGIPTLLVSCTTTLPL